ncbi:MAG TPA: hypothetical protein PK581_04325 [Caldisericia bacterium]|jgi:hypothetical protein|nr:hypothetical protein [Caldisericia bacterium]
MKIKHLPYEYGVKSEFPKAIIIKEDASEIVYHSVKQFKHYLILDENCSENSEQPFTVIEFDNDAEFRKYMSTELGFDLKQEE